MKPAIQFLELLVDNPEKIFEEYIVREENCRKGIHPAQYYLNNTDSDSDSDIDLIDYTEETIRAAEKRKKNLKIRNYAHISDDMDDIDDMTPQTLMNRRRTPPNRTMMKPKPTPKAKGKQNDKHSTSSDDEFDDNQFVDFN